MPMWHYAQVMKEQDIAPAELLRLHELQRLVWPAMQAAPAELPELLAAGNDDAASASAAAAFCIPMWTEPFAQLLPPDHARMAGIQAYARDQPALVAEMFDWICVTPKQQRDLEKNLDESVGLLFAPWPGYPAAYGIYYRNLIASGERWEEATPERRDEVIFESIWMTVPDYLELDAPRLGVQRPISIHGNALNGLMMNLTLLLGERPAPSRNAGP
jgi:hypothetical protein